MDSPAAPEDSLAQATAFFELEAENCLHRHWNKDIQVLVQHHPVWAADAPKAWQARNYLDRRVLEQVLQLEATRVLDVGCGFGTTLHYLWDSHQAEYAGITLSRQEFQTGSQMVRERNLHNCLKLFCGDFHDALIWRPFPARDLVFSLESFQAAWEPEKVLAGIARSLRQGGRWVCAGFMAADPLVQAQDQDKGAPRTVGRPGPLFEDLEPRDVQALDHFRQGSSIGRLLGPEQLIRSAGSHGLQPILDEEHSSSIRENLLDRIGALVGNPFSQSAELRSHRHRRAQGLAAQAGLLHRGLLSYRLMVFAKAG